MGFILTSILSYTNLLDSFVESQAYAVIVLPNGGPDLETFSVSPVGTNSGVTWRQACSIFWQVARALAHAEDLVHFEVRHSSLSFRAGINQLHSIEIYTGVKS